MKIPFWSLSLAVLLLSACCLDEVDSDHWSVEELNDSVYYVMEVGGKLAYLKGVGDATGTKFYFVYDGKELGKEYDDVILNLYDINGKPAFFAKDKNKSFIVYDGKEYGKDYDYVDSIFSYVGEEIVYFAIKDNKSFIVQGEKEIGKEYDEAAFLLDINESDLRGYDPEEIRIAYDVDGRPSYKLLMPAFGEVNGKLAYVAEKDGRSFIVYDGQEIGKEYDRVYTHITVGNHTYLNPVNGKLTYIAMKKNRTYIIHDGREIGAENYTINPFFVTGCGGRLVYVASRNNKSFIVYDGDQTGKEYDDISNVFEHDGKLVYLATEGEKSFAVYDGKEIGKEYDSVHGIAVLNGKLAYTVSTGRKTFLLYNNSEIGKEYDYVDSAAVIDGKLIYTAWKDNIHYLVREK